MSKIKLNAIVAIAKNNAIGKNNQMLWHIPEDFKFFKRTTMGKPMIMGRKTFESLPGMLPGREHIIISRSGFEQDGTISASSLEDGIEKARDIAKERDLDDIFIIGGAQIYKQAMPIIGRLYLTLVERAYEADAFFPELNWDEWEITEENRHESVGDTPAFTFFTLEKK